MEKVWQKALISESEDVRAVTELLTNNSLRIVLVVDEDKKLLGTVTDGDIRRALMAGHDMASPVTVIMQENPTVLIEGESRSKGLQLLRDRDLLHLPIVDSNGAVVGLETVQDFLYQSRRTNTVLLMAGGFGRRLYPLTRDVPKPMLPVGEKPILQVILERLIQAGLSHFFIAVHYHSDQVRSHFGDGSQWGVDIQYIEEKRPLGTAGALGLLDPCVVNPPLLMMNGDLLTGLDFGQLLDFHNEHHASATVCVREHDVQVPYGVVQGDGIRVLDIFEKPVKKFFINAGIYVLERDMLSCCSGDEVEDMPNLLRRVIDEGGNVNMFPVHEYWLDIGRAEDYERAQTQDETLLK